LDCAKARDYCRAVSAGFGQGQDIVETAVLTDILKGVGQDSGRVLAEVQPDEIKAALRAQAEEAQALAIFGAPSFVTADGELFWGNDRLEAALDWATR
jgi:2-hydroxychromene-2-carboxylate isomerase